MIPKDALAFMFRIIHRVFLSVNIIFQKNFLNFLNADMLKHAEAMFEEKCNNTIDNTAAKA